jgi:hypothetical protein
MSLIPAGGAIHDGAFAKAHGIPGIPSESEWGPIARDVELVRETGCRYHVCHVSTKESVDIIRRAKAEGLNVTCETGPHYLLMCQDDLMDLGGGGSGLTVKKNVSVEIDGNKEALQLKTNSRTTGTYYMPTKGKQDITLGDVGVIHFKARATALGSNDLFGSVRIMYERYSDWSKVAIDNFDIKYNEWEDFYLPFSARVLGTTVSAEWPADGSQICVVVNGLSQTIQIADFEVICRSAADDTGADSASIGSFTLTSGFSVAMLPICSAFATPIPTKSIVTHKSDAKSL